MSAVTICAGDSSTTSVRDPFTVTTFPCQCGVWKLNALPRLIKYQRTWSPLCMVIVGMFANRYPLIVRRKLDATNPLPTSEKLPSESDGKLSSLLTLLGSLV